MNDLRLQDLSRRAQEGLRAALVGQVATKDTVASLSFRGIRLMEGYGRKTAEEIQSWARRHGIEIKE